MTGANWTAHDWYKTSMFYGFVAILLFFSAMSGGRMFAYIGIPASAETQATVGVGCILLLLLQRLEAVLEELTDFKRDYWKAHKAE